MFLLKTKAAPSGDSNESSASDPFGVKIKAKTGKVSRWDLVRSKISTLSRGALIEQLRKEGDNADPDKAYRLGRILIEDGFGTKLKGQDTNQIYVGLLCIEWAADKGVVIHDSDHRKIGRAHFDVWRANTITADPFNLERAAELYKLALLHIENTIDSNVWLEYARVLEAKGEVENSATIIQRLLFAFEDSPNFASYLLYAGSTLKATQAFDRAGSYFFEAIGIGPPRLFSRLDMMFIVARSLEEASKDDETPIEDGYRMVHQHLIEEGLLDSWVEYDDWISDSLTWRTIADKCAVHHCYTLAQDLYGRGLFRDPSSFYKPKLWLCFAKACFRCGKLSEAQLALKQALSIDPYDKQILRALAVWNAHGRDPLVEECEIIPDPEDDSSVTISYNKPSLQASLAEPEGSIGLSDSLIGDDHNYTAPSSPGPVLDETSVATASTCGFTRFKVTHNMVGTKNNNLLQNLIDHSPNPFLFKKLMTSESIEVILRLVPKEKDTLELAVFRLQGLAHGHRERTGINATIGRSKAVQPRILSSKLGMSLGERFFRVFTKSNYSVLINFVEFTEIGEVFEKKRISLGSNGLSPPLDLYPCEYSFGMTVVDLQSLSLLRTWMLNPMADIGNPVTLPFSVLPLPCIKGDKYIVFQFVNIFEGYVLRRAYKIDVLTGSEARFEFPIESLTPVGLILTDRISYVIARGPIVFRGLCFMFKVENSNDKTVIEITEATSVITLKFVMIREFWHRGIKAITVVKSLLVYVVDHSPTIKENSKINTSELGENEVGGPPSIGKLLFNSKCVGFSGILGKNNENVTAALSVERKKCSVVFKLSVETPNLKGCIFGGEFEECFVTDGDILNSRVVEFNQVVLNKNKLVRFGDTNSRPNSPQKPVMRSMRRSPSPIPGRRTPEPIVREEDDDRSQSSVNLRESMNKALKAGKPLGVPRCPAKRPYATTSIKIETPILNRYTSLPKIVSEFAESADFSVSDNDEESVTSSRSFNTKKIRPVPKVQVLSPIITPEPSSAPPSPNKVSQDVSLVLEEAQGIKEISVVENLGSAFELVEIAEIPKDERAPAIATTIEVVTDSVDVKSVETDATLPIAEEVAKFDEVLSKPIDSNVPKDEAKPYEVKEKKRPVKKDVSPKPSASAAAAFLSKKEYPIVKSKQKEKGKDGRDKPKSKDKEVIKKSKDSKDNDETETVKALAVPEEVKVADVEALKQAEVEKERIEKERIEKERLEIEAKIGAERLTKKLHDDQEEELKKITATMNQPIYIDDSDLYQDDDEDILPTFISSLKPNSPVMGNQPVVILTDASVAALLVENTLGQSRDGEILEKVDEDVPVTDINWASRILRSESPGAGFQSHVKESTFSPLITSDMTDRQKKKAQEDFKVSSNLSNLSIEKSKADLARTVKVEERRIAAKEWLENKAHQAKLTQNQSSAVDFCINYRVSAVEEFKSLVDQIFAIEKASIINDRLQRKGRMSLRVGVMLNNFLQSGKVGPESHTGPTISHESNTTAEVSDTYLKVRERRSSLTIQRLTDMKETQGLLQNRPRLVSLREGFDEEFEESISRMSDGLSRKRSNSSARNPNFRAHGNKSFDSLGSMMGDDVPLAFEYGNPAMELLSAAALVRALQYRTSQKAARANQAFGRGKANKKYAIPIRDLNNSSVLDVNSSSGSLSIKSESLTLEKDMPLERRQVLEKSLKDAVAINAEFIKPSLLKTGPLGTEPNPTYLKVPNRGPAREEISALVMLAASGHTGFLGTATTVGATGVASSMKSLPGHKDVLLLSSLDHFFSQGYVPGGSSYYQSYWETKVDDFFGLCSSTEAMDKAIVNLQTLNSSIFLTRGEALCALAESDGNRFEAITKLRSLGYLQEVRAVNSMLCVDRAIVHAQRTNTSSQSVEFLPGKLSLILEQSGRQSERENWLKKKQKEVRVFDRSNMLRNISTLVGKNKFMVRSEELDYKESAARGISHLGLKADAFAVNKRGSAVPLSPPPSSVSMYQSAPHMTSNLPDAPMATDTKGIMGMGMGCGTSRMLASSSVLPGETLAPSYIGLGPGVRRKIEQGRPSIAGFTASYPSPSSDTFAIASRSAPVTPAKDLSNVVTVEGSSMITSPGLVGMNLMSPSEARLYGEAPFLPGLSMRPSTSTTPGKPPTQQLFSPEKKSMRLDKNIAAMCAEADKVVVMSKRDAFKAYTAGIITRSPHREQLKYHPK